MKRPISPWLFLCAPPLVGGIAGAIPLPAPVRFTLMASLLTIGAAVFGLLAVYEFTRPAQSRPGPGASWALIGVGFGLHSVGLWYMALRWGIRPSGMELGVGLALVICATGALLAGIIRLPRAEAVPITPPA